MDNRPYNGMWYRLTEDGFRRWRFAIMTFPGDYPIEDGEIRGSQMDAAAVAKTRIDAMMRMARA